MLQATELVIIVDDDFRIREAISDLLASKNVASVTFESAAEYLCFSHPDLPGCLVLDVSLPDINGHEHFVTTASKNGSTRPAKVAHSSVIACRLPSALACGA